MKIEDVPKEKKNVNIRKEEVVASGTKCGIVKCLCKKNCIGKSFKCIKQNVKYNSKCYGSVHWKDYAWVQLAELYSRVVQLCLLVMSTNLGVEDKSRIVSLKLCTL